VIKSLLMSQVFRLLFQPVELSWIWSVAQGESGSSRRFINDGRGIFTRLTGPGETREGRDDKCGRGRGTATTRRVHGERALRDVRRDIRGRQRQFWSEATTALTC
jgi:hypothetical protein